MQLINWITVIILIICGSQADLFFSKIISQHVPHSFCSRYYHRSGGVGCRTTTAGTLGVLLPYSSENEDYILHNLNYSEPIVYLMPSVNISTSIIDHLIKLSNTVGILIYGSESPILPYSPIEPCPGGNSTPSVQLSLHPDYIWNPEGLGLYTMDITIPISHIQDETSIQTLIEKAEFNMNNLKSHHYLVEMNNYMGPDEMDSISCLKRQNCVPIGGQSVWAQTKKPAKNTILFATALDSMGEFYNEFTDAQGTGITLSVALAVVKAVANAIANVNTTANFMVAFFQGESWGRVGSRLFITDIKEFHCHKQLNKDESPFNDAICTAPLKLSLAFTELDFTTIQRVIILDHIYSPDQHYYIHQEHDSVDSFQTRHFSTFFTPVSFLPPGIAESFYQAGIHNTIVISGYNETYSSLYGSSFAHINDDAFPSILKVTNSITAVLIDELVGYIPHFNVDEDYLMQLVQCFAINGTCTLMEDLLGLQKANHPYNKYAGTYSIGRQPYLHLHKNVQSVNYTGPADKIRGIYFSPSLLESFVHSELTLVFNSNITEQKCSTWKDCKGFTNGYCINEKCYSSLAYFHDAVDPELIAIEPGYFDIKNNSTMSPLYAEPYWGGYYGAEPYIRIYQKISPVTEWSIFITGLVLCIGSWFITKWMFDKYGLLLNLDN